MADKEPPLLGMPERRALARLLSQASRGETLSALPQASTGAGRQALVLAFTGAAGVGKSTLVGRLLPEIRKDRKTVAVLACDPQSPVTGGALLGDRFRLAADDPDTGIFIRSLATPSGQEGVASHLRIMIEVLERFGFDVILIETVGAGQGDVAVCSLADRTILLVQPETGDDLQWEKAGIFELADVVVVNKADLPGADQTEAQVKAITSLGDKKAPLVMRVSSKNRQDVEKLWVALREMSPCPGRASRTDDRLLRLAQEKLRQWWHRAAAGGDPAWKDVVERNRSGNLGDDQAAAEILRSAGSDAP